MNTQDRATPSQIRRAATRNLESLKASLRGWSATEINHLAIQDGKNAVHMAAWFGHLENLDYLLSDFGCDMNVISTGQYSHGKTPIFFAATRSRENIVEYLLHRNVYVKIVNNKGQSVRSIAASHFGIEVVKKIQELENQQEGNNWWNFRASHSDGLEYGDLDPRFLDRELRDTDVVTEFAVNPTTKQSRKGSFLRRNPQLAGTQQDYSTTTTIRVQKKRTKEPPSLTSEEQQAYHRAWGAIQGILSLKDELWFGQFLGDLSCPKELLTVVRLNDKLRQPWIPEVAIKLRQYTRGVSYIEQLIQVASSIASSKREVSLLDKLRAQVEDPSSYRQVSLVPLRRNKPPLLHESVSPLWQKACSLVSEHLGMQHLESRNTNQLSLPISPEWVDTFEGLNGVKAVLAIHELVAIDTEWYDDKDDGKTRLATLQVAFASGTVLFSYVVDLIGLNQDYRDAVVDFVKWLFDGKFLLLGFAVHHNDVPKLEKYVGASLSTTNNLLDLQQIAATTCELPGLQATIARYSKIQLCKEEQCSDWARRPLTSAQLQYGGLDAAVLLVLVAELMNGAGHRLS